MAYSLRSIIKGSSVYTAGSFFMRATGVLLIPIYTRFLTPHDYGILGVLNVVITLMSALLSLGLYQAQTRYYHEFHEDKQRVGEMLFSVNVLMVGVAFAVCAVLTAFGKPLFHVLLKNDHIILAPFVVITLWTVFLNVINQLLLSYHIATRQYTYSATLQFVQFLVTTGSIIFFVVLMREGALGSIKGVLAGHALFFIIFYWRYATNFVRRFNIGDIKAMLAMGLPVMIHLLAGAAMVSIDRLVLTKYLTLTDVGLYTLGFSFGSAMSIIVMSINRAWMPNYYQLMKQQDVDRALETRRMFCVWITAIGAACIAGSVWSRELVELFTTERFFGAARVVPLILVGFFFQGVYYFMVGPLFYFKKTILLPVITLTAAFANIGLNFFLIPKFGIMGAAAATAFSFMIIATMAYFIGRRYYNPQYEVLRSLVLIGVVVAGSIAALLNPSPLLETALIVGYLILCYMFFPSYLKPIAIGMLSYVRRNQ